MLAFDPAVKTHPASARLVWLFDVDGTLLLTQGAAHEAFVRAVRSEMGIEDALEDIAFAGRTEPLIVGDILAKHGRAFTDGEQERFFAAVVRHMRDVFHPGRGGLLDGVPAVLDAIEREPGWEMALLTGNMTRMAEIKLERFGILERFAFGAFGEEAADRNALACIAVERARERYGVSAARCVVVGDTEKDIACARAAGARVVAVATGSCTRAELERHRPDLLLDDLTSADALLEWARALEREPD